MLKDDLLAEYLLFKEGVKGECRSLDDMTDREQAGMMFFLYGIKALEDYDILAADDPDHVLAWPETRSIIERALMETAEPPGSMGDS